MFENSPKIESSYCSASTKTKKLSFSFILTEDIIKTLDSYARNHFEKMPKYLLDTYCFKNKVTFRDLSSDSSDNLDDLLNYACSNNSSPTDLILEWSALVSDPILETAYIKIVFHTDIQKDSESLVLLGFPIANISYEICGPDREWVAAAARYIEPVLKNTHIGNFYKPLMIFKNAKIIQVLSVSLPFFANLSLNLLSNLISSANAKASANILSSPDILNLYIQYSSTVPSISLPIMALGASISLMVTIFILGYLLLPKLVPRSAILIGLETIRYLRYINIFKFIVFSILFGCIIVPAAFEIIRYFLKVL